MLQTTYSSLSKIFKKCASYFAFSILLVVCISLCQGQKSQNRFYISLCLGSVNNFCQFIFHNVFCICIFLSILTAAIQICTIINSCLDSWFCLLNDLPAFSFLSFYSHCTSFYIARICQIHYFVP